MRGARAVAVAVSMFAALEASGCGYELARGATTQRIAPELGEVETPDATLAAAALDGARTELARAGALGTGGGAARLVVDLLRVDERGEAIVAEGVAGAKGPAQDKPPRAGPLLPHARGVRVDLVGRARLYRGELVERDTGEVHAAEVVSAAPTIEAGLTSRGAAADVAAQRLGARLARRILGFPEPSEP